MSLPRRAVLRSIGYCVLVLAVAAGAFGWWTSSHREGVKFSAMFTTTVGIYRGSDVRMLGVRVGGIDSVTPMGPQVKVSMHLNPGVDAPADTGAVIVAPSVVSDRYVQLTRLYTSGAKLASGAQIPTDRTATPVELDQIYSSLNRLLTALGPNGANSNGALSDLLNTGAANLQGNGAAINKTIDQLSQATSTLSNSKDALFATIANLRDFTGMLSRNNDGVKTVNKQLASITQLFADERDAFAAALHQLGSALGSVQHFINDNRSLIKKNVDKLSSITQTLVKQRANLNEVLSVAPLALQNLLRAYDPKYNVLRGRANLNELGLWPQSGSSSSAPPPPVLIPSSGSR
jgi:virulence factor Mce-like protein